MGLRLVVLASGRGSNFEAIAHAVKGGAIPNSSIEKLITYNPQAEALVRAKALDVSSLVINEKDRKAFEMKMVEEVKKIKPDFICLAGYMRLLSKEVIQAFPNQILNIHPSLLPSFPGLHAQRQAIEHGVKVSGCTVHFVDEGLDSGPIVHQLAVSITEGETEASLAAKLLPIEHRCYVEALAKLASR